MQLTSLWFESEMISLVLHANQRDSANTGLVE